MAGPLRMLGMTAPRGTSVARVPRRAATASAVLAAAGTLVLGVPSTALAHDGLVSTSPVAGATVAEAPDALELDFTGEPLPLGTIVAVTGPDGAPVSSGDAEIRGTTVVQPIDDAAEAGTYRVEWRSTSSDGHPLSGTFDFTVTEDDAAPAAAGTSPAAADAPSDEGASDEAAADEGIAPVWPAAGAVVFVGLGAVVVTRLRRRG
jgi:methionine-rich copper-binding protein CopC